MTDLKKGDYVLATKWSDGSPQDQWAIGLYDGLTGHKPARHLVVDSNGSSSGLAGFAGLRQSSLKLATGCSLAKTRSKCPPSACGAGKNTHAKS